MIAISLAGQPLCKEEGSGTRHYSSCSGCGSRLHIVVMLRPQNLHIHVPQKSERLE